MTVAVTPGWPRNMNRFISSREQKQILVWLSEVVSEGGRGEGQELLKLFFFVSVCFFSFLSFRSDPVLLSAAEVSQHFKSWWRLTGFYGELWSCRLQLWGEDSSSSPAVSFVWALGIAGKEKVLLWVFFFKMNPYLLFSLIYNLKLILAPIGVNTSDIIL